MGEIESLCYLHRPIRVKLNAYIGHMLGTSGLFR
jgi:hypothetical protein